MLETNNQYWPLSPKGGLDPTIFDENFIKDVFYKHIPKYYSCTQATVRKGLQNIYKKNSLSKTANPHNNEIAVSVCSKYKLRLQLPNLKISLTLTIMLRWWKSLTTRILFLLKNC